MRRIALLSVLATLLLLASASAALASPITVTQTGDPTGTGDCLGADTSCSLRQAVDAENGTAAGGDTIVLGANAYSLTQGTDIIATKPFDLQGAGVASTTIDGSQNSGSNQFGALARILRVDSGATVVIQGVTFTGGFDEEDETCSSGCNAINASGGGDLFNNGGDVTLDGVAFTNNFSSATTLGGAVSNGSGSLTMNDVSFIHNAAGAGGALFTRSGTVSGNGVTFSENATTCCEGAAAYLLGGTVTLVNTTIVSSGGFDAGGAIANGGANLTLNNDTLSNTGADIQTDRFATTKVENTILGTGLGGSACVASGREDSLNDGTTGAAITADFGYDLDQDNSCGLLAAGDESNVDPRLVPLFDNGGPTLTDALLAGSPALGDPATTNCPPKDQRGTSRPSGSCDIGAFEAVKLAAPTASTGDVGIITDSSAKLTGTINLHGEAGGFHFAYGTSQDDLSSRSDEVAAGVVSTDTMESETLSGLTPDTKYFFEAVADNASASTPASAVESFTTQPGPPVISNVSVDSITDTTAIVHFSVNPQGSDTTYSVEYGADSTYGQQAPDQPGDAGSAPGFVDESVTLTGLDPGSTVHFDVVATNDVQQVDNGDELFPTLQAITGVTGATVQVSDSGDTFTCPSADDTPIDWGDGNSDTGAQFQCSDDGEDGTDYTLSDSHIYNASGTYPIVISYGDLGEETDVIAHITANPDGLTNTAPPAISGSTIEGQALSTDNGGWDGTTLGFDYQWLDCDSNGQNCTNTGDDDPNYTLSADDLGKTIRVIVTAGNDHGSSDSLSDPTDLVTAGGSAPTNSGPPVITGVAQQGHTLTTTDGTWDGDPTHFDYQWQDCDSGGQNCANTGTDTITYALTSADVGHTIRVIVTASNDAGPGQAASSRTAVVAGPSTTPPPTSASSPTAGAASARTVTVTGAGFSGSVTPNGLPTQAYFQYGLDPRYSGGGPIVYDHSTAPQSVGTDFTSHAVGPVAISGLVPNALYHVRLVASNSDGATFGPDVTFTTAAAPAPGAPTLGKTVDVTPVSGLVLIKINGKFVPLTGADQIPSGSQIDARHGSLELITSTGQKGKTQHGTFGGAIFKLTQERSGARKGLVTLSLVEGAFKGAPSYAICKAHAAADATIASSKTLQLLKASAHGKFRTTGRYSAATVRGTKWTVADRCDGTLTHVITDSVAVTDFVRHKTIILRAGQSYLARSRKAG
jgi:hypothetical protein